MTRRQAIQRMRKISQNPDWLDCPESVEEYSGLQAISKLLDSELTESQIRAEMAGGDLTEIRVYGPRFSADRSEWFLDSVGNYLIYRFRGGAELTAKSDAIGDFPSFGV